MPQLLKSPTRLALGSLCIGLVVLALKYAAYDVTGSVALYSDALESIINVVTALAALAAVRLAARPANDTLPYGYHKAEYFSAVFEGAVIIVAAILIFEQAWYGYFNPTPLAAPVEGLALNSLATALNALWCFVLLRAGRRLRSPAIEADGQHLLTDVVSSAGVVAGLVVVALTGWAQLDAAIAALVGLNILWSGGTLVMRSVGGLMDVALPEKDLETIRQIIQSHADGALQAHDIRTRRAGQVTFVDFHLVVSGAMSVDSAHTICDRIEAALRQAVERCQVTIHVEPEDKAKHTGIVVL